MDGIPDRVRSALAHRYPIERELGSGGMAVVYLAQDRKHDRPVAVKVLRSDYASGLGSDRFLREIKIAARLTHPHILPLFDSGEAAGFLYYVMPYVPGESLRDRLQRETQLPLEDAVEIARQVAEALEYAHQQGIVHRDIKPGNILITEGQAVVADFGVARAITAAATQPATVSGVVVGTPHYMSPEQASGERELDGRSDVYALGCVLYEMLTGEPPFGGRTAQAVIAKHITEPPPSLQALRPSVPAWLEQVVHKALAKSPTDRFQTGAGLSQAMTSKMGVRPGLGRLVLRARRHRIAIGLTAAALVAAAAVMTLTTKRAGPDIEAAASLPLTRVAVLYFDDHSEGGKLDYLAARLTEHLIHELAQVQALRVVSRTDVKPYRQANVSVDTIAQRHGVGAVVEGSVTGTGEAVTVTVQLIDAATQVHLKSEVVSKAHPDPDSLPILAGDEIAGLVLNWLGAELRLREERAGTESGAAWTLVQRATQSGDDASRLIEAGDSTAAVRALERADSLLALAEAADPEWLWPIVQRADLAYKRGWELGPADQVADPYWLEVALTYVDRAQVVRPNDPAALLQRGMILERMATASDEPGAADSLRNEAEQALLTAADLDSTRAAEAWTKLGQIYNRQGRPHEALLAVEHAYQAGAAFLDYGRVHLFQLCLMSLELEQWDALTRWCEEGRRRFPTRESFVGVDLVALAGPRGPEADVNKAWMLAERFVELSPERHRDTRRPATLMQVAGVLVRAGLPDSARAVMRAARNIDEWHAPLTDYYEANVRLQLGDTERALELLSAYLEAEPAEREYLKTDWWWDKLHDDQRFLQLVRPTE